MKQSIQMCEGSLWKNIFFFSVPIMFAQILEVLFNLSDVAIVEIAYFLDPSYIVVGKNKSRCFK